MKVYVARMLILLGVTIVVLSVLVELTDRRLAADGCSQECTSNNHVCYGSDYSATCTCNVRIPGKTWADSPTYGSTSGNTMVSTNRKICYIEHVCMITPIQNSKCMEVVPEGQAEHTFGCVVTDGFECGYVVNMLTPIKHYYSNCVSGMCIEE